MTHPRRVSDSLVSLELTHNETQEILTETNAIIAETLLAFDKFIANGRQLDMQRWKFLNIKHGMQFFCMHKPKNTVQHSDDQSSNNSSSHNSKSNSSTNSHSVGSSSSSSSSSSLSHNNHSSDDNTYSAERNLLIDDTTTLIDRFRPANKPLIVATGVIDGTVEDAAFGILSNTEPRWRVRNSYVIPHFEDRKILATIQGPSEENPFRFVGVKWSLRNMGAFMKNRDIVYAESTGVAVDAQGKKYCYTLLQSLGLRNQFLPELKEQFDIIRGTLSICFIYRPFNKTTVEFFGRAFVDHKGMVINRVSLLKFSETLLAANTVIECAYNKKLMWLLQHHKRRPKLSREESPMAPNCYACSKHLHVSLASSAHGRSRCQLCNEVFCGKCRVVKRLSFLDVENEVTQRSMVFCSDCVQEAKQLPAWDVAMDTLYDEW